MSPRCWKNAVPIPGANATSTERCWCACRSRGYADGANRADETGDPSPVSSARLAPSAYPLDRHAHQQRSVDVAFAPGIGTAFFQHLGDIGQNELLGIE